MLGMCTLRTGLREGDFDCGERSPRTVGPEMCSCRTRWRRSWSASGSTKLDVSRVSTQRLPSSATNRGVESPSVESRPAKRGMLSQGLICFIRFMHLRHAAPLEVGVPEPCGVRECEGLSLGGCQEKRGKPIPDSPNYQRAFLIPDGNRLQIFLRSGSSIGCRPRSLGSELTIGTITGEQVIQRINSNIRRPATKINSTARERSSIF